MRSKFTLVYDIRIEHAFLFQIIRDGVLRQKRRLQLYLGADPFAFAVWSAGGMFAGAARAELWSESCALDLVKLLYLTPGFIADGSGYIDF